MAEFKDLLLKIANNSRLTPMELAELGRFGTETQLRNSFVTGNTTPQGGLKIDSAFDFIYSELLVASVASKEVRIPNKYNALIVFVSGRTNFAAYTDNIRIRFNRDSGTNYDLQYLTSFDTTISAAKGIGAQHAVLGSFSGASSTSSLSGSCVAFVSNIRSVLHKNTFSMAFSPETSAGVPMNNFYAAAWKSASPIDILTIFSSSGENILAGSFIGVYGLI